MRGSQEDDKEQDIEDASDEVSEMSPDKSSPVKEGSPTKSEKPTIKKKDTTSNLDVTSMMSGETTGIV